MDYYVVWNILVGTKPKCLGGFSVTSCNNNLESLLICAGKKVTFTIVRQELQEGRMSLFRVGPCYFFFLSS